MYGAGGQKRVPDEFVRDFTLAFPPLSEQSTIAAFLDRETAKIDALVAEQQRLIELLKEKRQTIITRAVTKGLNLNAPMKPSGVKWIGEIPDHWQVTKIGRYIRILSGFAFSSADFSSDAEDVPLLRGINVGVGKIKWDEVVYWRRQAADGLDRYSLNAGDIVIGMDRPWIREGIRIARITPGDVPCLLLQRVAALFPTKQLDHEFLFHVLSSKNFVNYFTPDMTGVSVPHLSPEQIWNYPITLPPIDEQVAIAMHLNTQSSRLEELAWQAERSIEVLLERRTALISAAVTGKIDVRGLVLAKAEAA